MTTTSSSLRGESDQGAVLVLVAILITALVGVGAFTIDLGALYAEKRQLQNGADAAALAVAQDCAQGNCGSYSATAAAYADLNAHDGASAVDAVCGKGPGLPACTDPAPSGASQATGWVRVKASTEESDGGRQIHYVMAPVMNAAAGGTVRASAVAAWGALGSGTVLPLTFSVCEWSLMGGSISKGTFPVGHTYVYFHGVGGTDDKGVSCSPSPSGQDLPGGFGYLANNACLAAVTVGAWIGVETGNSLPKGCNPDAWLNTEVLIALYDQSQGNGNNGQYHIAGLVGFTLLGFDFQGNTRGPSGFKCPLDKGNKAVCVYGDFTRYATDGSGFGGNNYGATVIKMVG